MEFSKQEYWSSLPFSSPGDLPDPGTECKSLPDPGTECKSLTLQSANLITSAMYRAEYTFENQIICKFGKVPIIENIRNSKMKEYHLIM